jgi:hypothetical protein
LSAASLKATLMNTVDPLLAFTGFNRTGGRLNVGRALQTPTVCSFNLSTAAITARTKGGYYSVTVTAPPNCEYSIKSNANWINLENPQQNFGSGNGTVTFYVRFNRTISRSGTITVAGQTVTVTQSRP